MTSPAESRNTRELVGDLAGGLSAALVLLPSSVAFGLIVFGPLGPDLVAFGALAGLVGAIALGIVAPLLGGTPRLVTGPCAPAAAALAGVSAAFVARPAGEAIALLTAVVAICGMLQLAFGLLKGGRLVKFLPYPVVSGFLSAVGLLIIGGQLPKLLALPRGVPLQQGILAPASWNGYALIVGATAAALMVFFPKVTKKVPAPVVALLGATGVYLLLGLLDPALLTLDGNRLVIGRVEGGFDGLVEHVGRAWAALGTLDWASLSTILAPAATLAVLLSIDTLKTSIVVDAMTKSRHDSNRELIGQGVGNLTSALLGGIAGAGTTSATLVNLSSGGRTKISGLVAGLFCAVAFLALGSLVAWIPVAAMAGILIVGGLRMIDRSGLRLLRNRATALDFMVKAAVVVTALKVDLMGATVVGIALAILLFVREQVRTTVVRRRLSAAEVHSKKQRLPEDFDRLVERGKETTIFELQGSLFFGTTDKLLTEIEPGLRHSRHVVLDMRRVHAVDLSAARLLATLALRMTEQGGRLLFAHLPRSLPNGQNLDEYLKTTGVVGTERGALIFSQLYDALEWLEDRVLDEARQEAVDDHTLELAELPLFRSVPPDVIKALAACAKARSCPAGSAVFRAGQRDDHFYVIRRGEVRVLAPLSAGATYHVATFGQGDFFGDIAFLDGGVRSADAMAVRDTELFAFSRSVLDAAAASNPKLGWHVFSALARELAVRLRHTNTELHALLEA